MTDPAIAQTIREVLAEELAKVRSGGGAHGAKQAAATREEWVSVASDVELNDLVRRLLAFANVDEDRKAFERGEIVFRLKNAGASSSQHGNEARPAEPCAATQIASGVVSERQVDRLPTGTAQIQIGKAVRLTPLAKDRLRQRGIAIERIEL